MTKRIRPVVLAGAAVAVVVPNMLTTGAVAAVPVMSASAAPQIVGTPNVGQTLQVTDGTWTSTEPIRFSYAWQRCTATNVCSTVPGATSSSYTLTAADQYEIQTFPDHPDWGTNLKYGRPLRIQAVVTASTAGGSAQAVATTATPVARDDVLIGGGGGGFDTMVENHVTKPMTWAAFNAITSPWWRHCLGGDGDPGGDGDGIGAKPWGNLKDEPERITLGGTDPAPFAGTPGAGTVDQRVRFEIRDGDIDPVTNLPDRQRCSLISHTQVREGADTWTRFQLRLDRFPFDPADLADNTWFKWAGVWGLHSATGGVSGPAALAVRSDTSTSAHFELVDGYTKEYVNGRLDNWIRWRSPSIELGRWYDFVIHVKSSRSDSVGRMQVWVDGVPQPLRDDGYRKTLIDEYGYPQFGLYRSSEIQGPAVMHGDGYRMGLTPESVGCVDDPATGVRCPRG